MILGDDNANLMLLTTKKTYTEQLWRLTFILPPKSIEFPQHLMVKIFHKVIFMSPFHCENKFTVPMIKLRMFGGYIVVIGASMEAKTQVISICTLFSDLSN